MFSFSISMSSTSATRASRSSGSKRSSNSCFSSMESCRLAAIVSASFRRLIHAHGGDHGLVVQRSAAASRTAQTASAPAASAARPAASISSCVCRCVRSPTKNPSVVIDLVALRPLHSLNQHFDVAVRHLHALDDIADGAVAIDVVRPWARRREASCCVARKILRSPDSASSSARTLDSRPTTNGVIMYGKMTMSRMGIMGSLRIAGQRSLRWIRHVLPIRLAAPPKDAVKAPARCKCTALVSWRDRHKQQSEAVITLHYRWEQHNTNRFVAANRLAGLLKQIRNQVCASSPSPP